MAAVYEQGDGFIGDDCPLFRVVDRKGSPCISRPFRITGNIKRDRGEVMRKIMSMNEDLFRKMYRLHRDDFFTLLEIIRPSLELSASSKRAAINSSGRVFYRADCAAFCGSTSGVLLSPLQAQSVELLPDSCSVPYATF